MSSTTQFFNTDRVDMDTALSLKLVDFAKYAFVRSRRCIVITEFANRKYHVEREKTAFSSPPAWLRALFQDVVTEMQALRICLRKRSVAHSDTKAENDVAFVIYARLLDAACPCLVNYVDLIRDEDPADTYLELSRLPTDLLRDALLAYEVSRGSEFDAEASADTALVRPFEIGYADTSCFVGTMWHCVLKSIRAVNHATQCSSTREHQEKLLHAAHDSWNMVHFRSTSGAHTKTMVTSICGMWRSQCDAMLHISGKPIDLSRIAYITRRALLYLANHTSISEQWQCDLYRDFLLLRWNAATKVSAPWRGSLQTVRMFRHDISDACRRGFTEVATFILLCLSSCEKRDFQAVYSALDSKLTTPNALVHVRELECIFWSSSSLCTAFVIAFGTSHFMKLVTKVQQQHPGFELCEKAVLTLSSARSSMSIMHNLRKLALASICCVMEVGKLHKWDFIHAGWRRECAELHFMLLQVRAFLHNAIDGVKTCDTDIQNSLSRIHARLRLYRAASPPNNVNGGGCDDDEKEEPVNAVCAAYYDCARMYELHTFDKALLRFLPEAAGPVANPDGPFGAELSRRSRQVEAALDSAALAPAPIGFSGIEVDFADTDAVRSVQGFVDCMPDDTGDIDLALLAHIRSLTPTVDTAVCSPELHAEREMVIEKAQLMCETALRVVFYSTLACVRKEPAVGFSMEQSALDSAGAEFWMSSLFHMDTSNSVYRAAQVRQLQITRHSAIRDWYISSSIQRILREDKSSTATDAAAAPRQKSKKNNKKKVKSKARRMANAAADSKRAAEEAAAAAEEKKRAEAAAEAEEKKRAEAAAAAEDKKKAAASAAEDKKNAEAAAAEDKKKAAASAAEDKKKAEAAAAAEEKKAAAFAAAEEKKKAAAAAAAEEKKRAEAAEAAEDKKKAAASAAAEEKKRAEAAAAEAKKKAEAAAAEEKKRAEAAAAEAKKKAEAAAAEAKKKAEAAAAEEKKRAEAAAAEEKKRAEAAAAAEEKKKAAAAAAEEKKRAEAAAAAEAKKRAKAAAAAEAKKRAEAAAAEEKKRAEAAAAEEKKRAEAAAAEEKKRAEAAAAAEAKKRAEAAAAAEEKKRAEAAAAAEEKKRAEAAAAAEEKKVVSVYLCKTSANAVHENTTEESSDDDVSTLTHGTCFKASSTSASNTLFSAVPLRADLLCALGDLGIDSGRMVDLLEETSSCVLECVKAEDSITAAVPMAVYFSVAMAMNFIGGQAHVTGSAVIGTCTRFSDIDIMVSHPMAATHSGFEMALASQIALALQQTGEHANATVQYTIASSGSMHPVITSTHVHSHASVNVAFFSTARACVAEWLDAQLKYREQVAPDVRSVVRVLKLLLHRAGTGATWHGGIPGSVVVHMVCLVVDLSRRAGQTQLSPGRLLLYVLLYFGRLFDPLRSAVSVQPATRLESGTFAECQFFVKENGDDEAMTASPDFVVESPFCLQTNLAAGAYLFKTARCALASAFCDIVTDPAAVLLSF